MNLYEITKFIDDKIEKDDNKIIVSFYELKVKANLSDDDLFSTIKLISTRLLNLGYKVYSTGEKYIYNGKEYTVERNELIIAIK